MANRVTQVATEAVVAPTSGNARLTQVGVVAIVDTRPPARVTQYAVLIIRANTPDDAGPPRTSRASFVG